jgi:uncharacterized membrane protein YdjX (TVP38/TMEM64 family)
MKRPFPWRAVAGLLILLALITAARLLPVGSWLEAFKAWVAAQGASGYLVFVLVYAAAAVLFVPGSILTIGAGVLFGLIGGFLAVSVASVLGASLAFLVARYLMRGQVEKWAAENPRFAAIDRAVGREGWKIVLLTRLSPVFPFNLLNYLYGLTQVRFRDYVLASWIGMMPGTLLYVYLGFAGEVAARAAAGTAQRTPQEYAFWAVGLLATLAVTVHVTRLARRALQEKTG